jgi:hypothetical protein
MVLEQLEDVIKDRNLQKSIADRNAKKVSVLKKHFNKQQVKIEEYEQTIEKYLIVKKIIFFTSLLIVSLLAIILFNNFTS